MTELAQAVMAVVHVQAPAQVDPHAIEAELVRAINTYQTADVSRVHPGPRPPRASGRWTASARVRRHLVVRGLHAAGRSATAGAEARAQGPSTPLRPAGLGRGRNQNDHRRDRHLLVRCSRHTTSLALNSNSSSGGPDPLSRASSPPSTHPMAGSKHCTDPQPRLTCSAADMKYMKYRRYRGSGGVAGRTGLNDRLSLAGLTLLMRPRPCLSRSNARRGRAGPRVRRLGERTRVPGDLVPDQTASDQRGPIHLVSETPS